MIIPTALMLHRILIKIKYKVILSSCDSGILAANVKHVVRLVARSLPLAVSETSLACTGREKKGHPWRLAGEISGTSSREGQLPPKIEGTGV